MIAAKKTRKAKRSNNSRLHAVIAWLLGPGKTALIAAAAFVLIGGGTYLAWLNLGERIIAAPDYWLDPQRVEITPQPEWVHSDVRAEALGDPTLDGRLSLMEDDLCARIEGAFKRHPWVAEVARVEKLYPASVRVELKYRRPVCMVKVADELLPVDADGFLLPERDFSPGEKADYPCLEGVDRGPIAPPGNRWPDAKVVGGAEIAAALGHAWKAMGLHRIIPLEADPTVERMPNQSRRSAEPFFALLTRGGTRILWGYAPRAGAADELPVEEKVARLKRYLAEHDTLDDPRNRQKLLDVRTMPPSVGR
ncbi:MAG: hypothetical protein JW959_12840 [Pirellulales bacterium]|nr:hypothetical protein [Pirellulales bacterium]